MNIVRYTKTFIDSLLHGEFLYLLWAVSPPFFRFYCRLRGIRGEKVYALYQKVYYEHFARIDEKELVVGHFASQEHYHYEKYLLKKIPKSTSTLIALDFGCGPGRMIKTLSKQFRRVDGVDISQNNIQKARTYTRSLANPPRYFVNNGYDLAGISSRQYDLVYTTIALHHIPIHDTRYNLLREFYRVLKPGGSLSLQMVYTRDPKLLRSGHRTSRWWENPYDANGTNGTYDVVITPHDVPKIKKDFNKIGFKNFSYLLAPPPTPREQSLYDNWIYLYAVKPKK